jgi:hypothetical protein
MMNIIGISTDFEEMDIMNELMGKDLRQILIDFYNREYLRKIEHTMMINDMI